MRELTINELEFVSESGITADTVQGVSSAVGTGSKVGGAATGQKYRGSARAIVWSVEWKNSLLTFFFNFDDFVVKSKY